MKNRYHGTGVALVTPYDDNNNIDVKALRKLVNHVINGGVDYLVALGTTGETSMLDEKEQRKVLDIIIEENNKRVPIVAGNFADNNTARLCAKLKSFNFEGIDAILSASPAYVKPSQEGIFQHYKQVVDASPLPIIIYNVPGRTSSNISVETMVRLSHYSDKFLGVKEASGDINQGTKMIKKCREDFFVTSGDDMTALGLMACGAKGVISVIANVYPEFSDIYRAFEAKNIEKASELNQSYTDIHPVLYVEGNPVGIKAALEIKDICKSNVRLPMVKLSEENRKKLEEVMY